MERIAKLVLVLALLGAMCADAQHRLTPRCNTSTSEPNQIVLIALPSAGALYTAWRTPAPDDTLVSSLWYPTFVKAYDGAPLDRYLLLYYEPLQDVEQILMEIVSDSLLASYGVRGGGLSAYACPGVSYGGNTGLVTEYHNRISGHYFLSSSSAESTILDTGLAGAGWERTGESFNVYAPDICSSRGTSRKVIRFYAGPPTNTHFYTADPDECGAVRSSSSAWVYEGVAFGADLPVNGMCPSLTLFGGELLPLLPVYRLYNNRWMYNDSNHRYVTRLDLYQEMMARGWIGEGIAMCVAPEPR